MTIVNEKAIMANILYLTLEFVELLEMLGRSAKVAYALTMYESLNLSSKY